MVLQPKNCKRRTRMAQYKEDYVNCIPPFKFSKEKAEEGPRDKSPRTGHKTQKERS